MKKLFALLLAATLLVSALSVSVGADFNYEGLFAEYEVLTASKISFSYAGDTSASAHPKGGSTLDCLIDGEHVVNPSNFDDKGIVLVCNDFIKPEYERKNGQAIQDPGAIPQFSFALEYDDEVLFDSIYLGMFYQAFDCVCAPGEHAVLVETSDDGKVWVPVGEDGYFYFRDNQPLYSGDKDPCSEEIVVYLGETVEAKHVRLSFKFKELDEGDDYWNYYTNVYEWCGFTELGVACYLDGEEPSVMTKEEAEAPAVALDGVWYAVEDEVAVVADFTTAGTMKLYGFVASDFEANGMEAEVMALLECTYTAGPDYILVDMEGELIRMWVEVDEESLMLDDGETPLVLDPYVPTEDPEAPETSDPETSEPEDPETSEPEESEASEPEESAPVVEDSQDEASAEADASETVDDDDDDEAEEDDKTGTKDNKGGIDTWVIVLIVVAAVAVVAVVVVVVVLKKKKS